MSRLGKRATRPMRGRKIAKKIKQIPSIYDTYFSQIVPSCFFSVTKKKKTLASSLLTKVANVFLL